MTINAASGFFAANIVIAGLAFIVYYTTRLPWWEREAGRNLIVVTVGLVGLAMLRVLTLMFGEGYRGQSTLRMILLGVVAVAIWWRLFMLVRYIAQGGRSSDDDEPDDDDS